VATAVLAASLVAPVTALGLDPGRLVTQYVHDTWTTRAGLPSQTVWSIVQTRKGYLWLGTRNGLARFDGVHFTVFDARNTPALHSNGIRSMVQDDAGNLWIGTYGSGVLRYRDGHFKAYTRDDGLASNVVYEVYRDHSGDLWFATAGGVSRLHDGRFKTLTTKDGLPGNHVYRIVEDHSGDFWFGTLTGGLVRDHDGRLTTFTTKDGLGSNQIHSLYVRKNGTLLAGTYHGGLYRYRKGRFESFGLPHGFAAEGAEALLEDGQGNLWIGTYGGGLIRDHDGHFSRLTRHNGLSNNYVFALRLDHEGDLWIGTRNGLDRLRNGKFLVYGEPEGLANPTFDVYQTPDGTIWVGTEGDGLFAIRDGRVTRHLTTADGLASNSVTSLVRDGSGGLWAGTFGAGLSHLHDGRITTRTAADGLPSNYVFALQRSRDGALWIATNAGIIRLRDGKTHTFTASDGLPGSIARVIRKDPHGGLWFGTNGGGLVHYSNGSFHAFTTADGLPNNLVYALRYDRHGDLWIGTRGGGLALYRHGKFFDFPHQRALNGSSIYGILTDGLGHLWLSTPNGLLRISVDALLQAADGARTPVAVTRFDESDGMRSSQFNGGFEPSAWKARDGTLWFPSNSGVVTVNPRKLETNPYAPPVFIESVLADGKPLDIHGHTPTLPAGVQTVEIHYTALSYAAPSQVRFRYRLDGLDKNWTDAGNRRVAYYAHLPAGRFDFQVIAANNDGVWNRKGASFTIVHSPYFYRTWWFYTVLALLGTLGIFGGYRLRVRHLRRHQHKLSNLVRERTRQLEDALGHVERLTRVDALTGLANRRGLEESMKREWERGVRRGSPLSLLMVDIDRFKSLNDSYGHQRGDQCLEAVAAELKTATRHSADLVGRWGGEEFIVLLPDTDGTAAGEIAERLRHQVLERRMEHAHGGIGGVLTVSVGVASGRPAVDLASYEALIAAADRALYRAKRDGRNRVCGPDADD